MFYVKVCSVDGRTLAECLLDVQQGDCLQYSHITICTNDGKVHNGRFSLSNNNIFNDCWMSLPHVHFNLYNFFFWLGACDYQRAICDAFYVHSDSLSAVGIGSNGVCHSIIMGWYLSYCYLFINVPFPLYKTIATAYLMGDFNIFFYISYFLTREMIIFIKKPDKQ